MVRPIDYAALTERTCTKCKITKPVADFGKRDDPKQPINGWRYYSQCRGCRNAASRDYGTADRSRRNARLSCWRKQNPTAARVTEQRKRLKYKYDLTPEQVAEMFASQGRRCVICDQAKPLVVDHDHATGAVRGGLCNRCNVLLGRVEAKPMDWPNLIEVGRELGAAMAAYLAWDFPAEGEPDHCHAAPLLKLANGTALVPTP
jgi:hypothetical protein